MNAKDMFGYWPDVRSGLLQTLDMLTDVQLDFVPRQGLCSLGNVVRHIAGTENGWFCYTVIHEVNEWSPDFTTEAYPSVTIIARQLPQEDICEVENLATVGFYNWFDGLRPAPSWFKSDTTLMTT